MQEKYSSRNSDSNFRRVIVLGIELLKKIAEKVEGVRNE